MTNIIVGGVTSINNPRTNWEQDNPNKADYLKNKDGIKNTFASSIKNTVSGETINLTDISPIEHTVGVKVSSKNLIPFPYYDKSKTNNGITYIVNDDGSITANGTATEYSQFYLTQPSMGDTISKLFEDGETYTLQGQTPDESRGATIVFQCRDRETNSDKYFQTSFQKPTTTFTTDKNKYKYSHIRLQISKGVTVNNLVFNPMIEKGSTATPYTPYISNPTTAKVDVDGNEYTPNTDGAVDGIKSTYPTMTITTDTVGVLVEAEYNADTKKYIDNKFAELQALVLEG